MGAASATDERRRIGRFEIVRVLGKGAQGTVFLARDTHLERDAAVKTLRLEHRNAGARGERMHALIEEARIVSRLQHPNIVTLFDAGEDRTVPYLVFEYVEGKTLAALIREKGKLPCVHAVDIARQLLRGIGFAHVKGVVLFGSRFGRVDALRGPAFGAGPIRIPPGIAHQVLEPVRNVAAEHFQPLRARHHLECA